MATDGRYLGLHHRLAQMPVLTRRPARQQAVVAPIRYVILTAYLVTIVLTVAMTKVSVGIPLRSLANLALLGFVALAAFHQLTQAISRVRVGIGLIGFFAVLGFVVSMINGVALGEIAQVVLEVHVQSLVALVLTAAVAECCGARSTLLCFVGVIATSALVALGQAVGLQPVWQLTESLALAKGPEAIDDLEKLRPLGISYSQTVFAGQLCLAFAAYVLARLYFVSNRKDVQFNIKRFLWAAFLTIAIAVASGNRAAILGVVLAVNLFLIHKNGKAFVFGLPLILFFAILVPTIIDTGQDLGLRAAQLGDLSSVGRWTLAKYGVLLFVNHPIGYGLTFDPTLFANYYYEDFKNDPGANLLAFVPLHNYPLSLINIYGFLAFAALPTISRLVRASWSISLLLLPYFVHCLFHNSGPFFNELYAWYVIGCCPLLLAHLKTMRGRFQPVSPMVSARQRRKVRAR